MLGCINSQPTKKSHSPLFIFINNKGRVRLNIANMDRSELSSSNSSNDLDVIMKKSQARMWKTLEGEPQFIISVAETQNVLDKFANSKINFVILNVDLVASTKLSITLPLDRLTRLIQSFNQEMSLIVKDFGGFILKYVGDAVLAFFVVGPFFDFFF